MIKQLTKRISAAALAALLIAFSCVCAFAESSKKLIDDAEQYVGEAGDQIVSALEDASSKTGWDVIVYTNNLGSSNLEYDANKYYDDHGFGKGAAKSGVMLTLDMSARKIALTTKGDAISYYDNNAVDDTLDLVYDKLSSGDTVGACTSFADSVVKRYNSGIPDGGNYSNVTTEPEAKPYNIWIPIIGLVIGIIAAVIFAAVVNSRYKHNGKYGTYELEKNSSMNLVDSQDVFVDRHVTYTTDPPPQSSSGSSGGSSGGSSHGGGSRSF